MEFLWWVSAVSQALVLCRLISLRVVGRYPFFASLLASSVLRSCVLLPHERASRDYLLIWVWTEPVLLLLMLLATVEALRRTLEAYPGRRDAFTVLLIMFSGVAVAFMVATAGLDGQMAEQRWMALRSLAVARRSLTGSLAVFLLGATCWLTWLPVPERENVRLHRLLMTVYFGSATVSQLAINVGFPRDVTNGAALAASILCYFGWLQVTKDGERDPARRSLSDGEIERMESDAQGYRELLR